MNERFVKMCILSVAYTISNIFIAFIILGIALLILTFFINDRRLNGIKYM